MKKVQVNVNLEPELKEGLAKVAKLENRSLSNLLHILVELGIKEKLDSNNVSEEVFDILMGLYVKVNNKVGIT